MVSVAFFAYIPHNGQAASVDWTVPAFAVLLPLFGLVWWGFQRREGALRDLAEGELLTSCNSLHCHTDFASPHAPGALPRAPAPAGRPGTPARAAHIVCAPQLAVSEVEAGKVSAACSVRRAVIMLALNQLLPHCDWLLMQLPPPSPRRAAVWQSAADGMRGRAVKTLVLHLSLAHRDWLPPGQPPPGHALTVQHTLHMLLGAGRGLLRQCVVLPC